MVSIGRAAEPDHRIADWVLGDPQLASVCSTAVEPLEIAARLETHGVSSQVAADTFGFVDVFDAADAVYRSVPFEDVDPPVAPVQTMGGPRDLLRGALYALPALFLPVVVTGFGLHISWWVLPVGLTVAWGTSQAATTIGWSLRGRSDSRSDALLPLAAIVIAALACLAVGWAAWWRLGGSGTSVVVAMGITVYIAASGILVFQGSELLLACCMVPAVLGSLLALGFTHISLGFTHISLGFTHVDVSHRAAAWSVVATVVLAVLMANRHLGSRGWHRPALGRADRARATMFFLYGTGCGLLLSFYVAWAGHVNGSGDALLIAVWPLLLTLGLMEWQLRSFRSRAESALGASGDLHDFGRRVGFAFRRSVTYYVGALVLLSAVAAAVGHYRHATSVPLLLASVGTLGISFFFALLLASSGRIDLVLVCWAATFAVLAADMAVIRIVQGHVTPTTGLISLVAAATDSIILLFVLSRPVLRSPLSY
jgi:hypothetical protein